MDEAGDANEQAGPLVRGGMEVPLIPPRLGSVPPATIDLPLWFLIEQTTKALSFNNYRAYVDYVLCEQELPHDLPTAESKRIGDAEVPKLNQLLTGKERSLPFTDSGAYQLLKTATEAFLTVNCGVVFDYQDLFPSGLETGVLQRILDDRMKAADTDIQRRWYSEYLKQVHGTDDRTLPFLILIRQKVPDWDHSGRHRIRKRGQEIDEELLRTCSALLQAKTLNPCLLELIWSYWHEQGMLVQTMNAIGLRFQNIRGPTEKDPLSMLELDPLRPLNNLLWGYFQDEQHRLSLVRRAYEYEHHYGLRLYGKAAPHMRPADSRSKFPKAFHNLLHLCSDFFKRDDDITVNTDAFPLLVALRDVHMLLTEGAHNQFGDLPTTARIEMLMQQWLLARPEFREVLPTRIMVDYPEPWMDRVDAMKRLQGWSDTNVRHYRDLGYFGEQILLTIRFGSWNKAGSDQAKTWVRYWRHSIQHYIYAYWAATGVDLTVDIT